MNARQRIEKCRTLLVLDAPFWGALSLNLTLIEDPAIDTARVDGKTLRFNPGFIDELTDPQVKGVLAHEVAHCAMGHFWRGASRDPAGWNVACDLEINPLLVDAGFTLPEGALDNPAYRDMSAEQIYAARAQQDAQNQQPGQAGQPGGDPGRCGAVDQQAAGAAEGTDDAGNTLADQWKVATVQAAKAARMRGDLPSFGARLLDELTRPALPWQTILADFVQRTARNDYTWKRPHRNYLQRGLFVPTLHNNELGDVVVAIDTSGSIRGETLSAFCQAVSDILSAYATTAHVVCCDARIQSRAEYRSEDLPIQVEPSGGGGTDFRPVFRWIQDQDIDPACLVYLTDLEGNFPEAEPDYPTLWAVIGDELPPWGERVQVPAA